MRESDKSARWFVRIGVLGVFLMLSSPVFAARPLPRFEVWVDGKPALTAFGGRRGEDADTLWQHLKEVEFGPANAGLRKLPPYRVEADADDPLRARLQGKIIIYVEEGGRADVSELKLVRQSEN